jgi:hypothetical protein
MGEVKKKTTFGDKGREKSGIATTRRIGISGSTKLSFACFSKGLDR